MLKLTLIALAAIIIVFTIVAAMQSSEFRVTRSTKIAAPPEIVFAHVNDHHKWEAWSPWAKADPEMKTSYEGPQSGVGAITRWSGNNEVGEGSSAIIESRPNEMIKFKLDFVRPFKGTNDVVFAFTADSDRTEVTWTMTGQRNFFFKALGLLMNCEKMCGDQFEKGLTQLKSVVESEAVVGT